MKKLTYWIYSLCLFSLSCNDNDKNSSTKTPATEDSVNTVQDVNSHLQRVYPDLRDTLGLDILAENGISLRLLNNEFIFSMSCSCDELARNYQPFNVGSTKRVSWKRFENQTIYIPTVFSNIGDLIRKPGIDPNNPKYYINLLKRGDYGCNKFCCNNGKLSEFTFDGDRYIHLAMAIHGTHDHGTATIDTIHNVEFRITDEDYKRLNDSLQIYKDLQGGVDSKEYKYLKVYKSNDTTLLFKINQKII